LPGSIMIRELVSDGATTSTRVGTRCGGGASASHRQSVG
jgi:hypothetical protein